MVHFSCRTREDRTERFPGERRSRSQRSWRDVHPRSLFTAGPTPRFVCLPGKIGCLCQPIHGLTQMICSSGIRAKLSVECLIGLLQPALDIWLVWLIEEGCKLRLSSRNNSSLKVGRDI